METKNFSSIDFKTNSVKRSHVISEKTQCKEPNFNYEHNDPYASSLNKNGDSIVEPHEQCNITYFEQTLLKLKKMNKVPLIE